MLVCPDTEMALADSTQLYGVAAGALVLVVAAVVRASRNPMKDIRGPAPSSFWLGQYQCIRLLQKSGV